jgi:hypothetical protein
VYSFILQKKNCVLFWTAPVENFLANTSIQGKRKEEFYDLHGIQMVLAAHHNILHLMRIRYTA